MEASPTSLFRNSIFHAAGDSQQIAKSASEEEKMIKRLAWTIFALLFLPARRLLTKGCGFSMSRRRQR